MADPVRRRRGTLIRLAILLLAGAVSPAAATAQAQGWGGDRVEALVERARARRQEPVVDSTLRTYRADVTGHIYFLLDAEERDEPVLLRADQVALELYWGQPNRVKQVVRGMRSEEEFPIRDFRYYLDRYTVIQNGFGDIIRVGEGRDVRDVVHPLAPGADAIYQYRLADSTTIRLPTEPEPLRVYEIQVRPRDFDVPAIVGSLFIARARADLVRLAFTFTPAAYIDPRNERVEIVLENALWEGYWLPREQRLLVRREMPQFDVDVGTVIRARLLVTDYELNIDLPRAFFFGDSVIMAAGPRGLEEYAFEEGLYEGLEAAGVAPGVEAGTLDEVDVDEIAGRIIRQRYFRGLSPVRLFAPTASHGLRFDRAEGLVTGAGASVGIGSSQLSLYGGYAWGSQEPVAEVGWEAPDPGDGGLRPWIQGWINRPRDLGLRPAAAGALSTLAATFVGQDFRDVHPVSGGEVGVTWVGGGGNEWSLAAAVEVDHAAEQAEVESPWGSEDVFRPVPPVVPGRRLLVRAAHERRLTPWGARVTLRPSLEAGWWDPDEIFVGVPEWQGNDQQGFGRLMLDLEGEWRSAEQDRGVEVAATGAVATGARPPQHLWYLGGRNTLPGHPFHAFVGDRAAVVTVTGWREVVPRWVRIRLLGAAGWSELDRPLSPAPGATLPEDVVAALDPWMPAATDGLVGSGGIGIGVLDGLIRLDYAVPFNGGDGSLMLSVDPRLWSFL